MPSHKPVRPDDKRLKANRPAPAKPKVKSRWEQLIDGDITVQDLDDEEVRRGQVRDKNGQFRSRPPTRFPRQLHDALRLEFQVRTEEMFRPSVETAYKVLQEVALNKRAAGPARVRAAEILLERGAGKVKETKEVALEVKQFEVDLKGIIVDLKDGE